MTFQICFLTVRRAAVRASKPLSRVNADEVSLEHVGTVEFFMTNLAHLRTLIRMHSFLVNFQVFFPGERFFAIGARIDSSLMAFHVTVERSF